MPTIKDKPFVVQKISIVGEGLTGPQGPQGPAGPAGDSVAFPIDSANIQYNGQALDDFLDALTYVDIDITSFTNNVGTVEVGSVLNAVQLNWTINKGSVTSQQITGTNIATQNPATSVRTLSLTSLAYDPDAITSANYTLTVGDGTSTDNATTSVNFYNKRYWSAKPLAGISNSFILAMSNELSNSKAKNINYQVVGSSDYLWYCYPSRLGTATFTDAETGFPAGFEDPITFSFTNASGFTEDYYVYRSTNAGLGAITVTVS